MKRLPFFHVPGPGWESPLVPVAGWTGVVGIFLALVHMFIPNEILGALAFGACWTGFWYFLLGLGCTWAQRHMSRLAREAMGL